MNQDKLIFATLKGSSIALGLSLLFAAGLGLDLGVPHAYWNLSRSAGVVAYTLLWASVMAGLVLSSRLGRAHFPPKQMMDIHEYISGATLAFCLFHALILAGDSYFQLSWAEILLPFASNYQRFWMGVGQLALTFTAAVTVSSYYRKSLGNQAWRLLHKVAFAAYWLGLAHAVAAASSSPSILLMVYYTVTGGVAFWLTAVRIFVRETPTP